MWHNKLMPTTRPESSKESFNRHKVRFLSGISFLVGFLDAFLLYIISSYFAALSGEGLVGGFYLAIYLIVLLGLMYLQPLLHRFGSVRLLLFFYSLLILCSVWLSLIGLHWIGGAVLLLFLIGSNLIGPVTDVLLEDFSSDQLSGRIRGLYLTVLNAGLLLAPFASTWVLSHYGYAGVFSIITAGYALVLIIALLGLRSHRTYSSRRIRFIDTLSKVIQRPNVLAIYAVSWILEFFYVVMIVYSPLLLLSYGYTWTDIGFIFTIMLVPFVLIQYPLGVLADKRFGEKELLFVSLVIMAIASIGVGWSSKESIVFWAILLFVTRIGASGIEVLRDAYFYKQITASDADIVAFFRTSRPVANIAAAILGVFFLAIFPVQGLFLLVGAFALAGCFITFFLKDTQSEIERG